MKIQKEHNDEARSGMDMYLFQTYTKEMQGINVVFALQRILIIQRKISLRTFIGNIFRLLIERQLIRFLRNCKKNPLDLLHQPLFLLAQTSLPDLVLAHLAH